MKLMVTGGAGYIGSVVAHHLSLHGYEVVIFDNLSTGNSWAVGGHEFFEGDLLDVESLKSAFSYHKPDAVLHFAAKAYVQESVKSPLTYYRNNVSGTINLLTEMVASGCSRLVFSSTCSIYGEVRHEEPITESLRIEPINPYAKSKLMVEEILQDAVGAYGISSVALRYFNAAGASNLVALGEAHDPEPHLIPNVISAAMSGRPVNVFGSDYPTRDGTCVRDYIHVDDLATGHIAALDYLLTHDGADMFNLGTGNGYSIREILGAVETAVGNKVEVRWCDRRAGDPARLVADPSRANLILGWSAEHGIQEVIESAYRWEKSRKGLN